MNEIESPEAGKALTTRLKEMDPEVMGVVLNFNDLPDVSRGYFNFCDACCKLVVYSGGQFMSTGQRKMPGTRRWCCFDCASLCVCGEWIHPRNIESITHLNRCFSTTL